MTAGPSHPAVAHARGGRPLSADQSRVVGVLDALVGQAAAAGSGRSHLVVLEGRAATGRSTVLEAVARVAGARGTVRVVCALGVGWEAGSPHSLLHQLVPHADLRGDQDVLATALVVAAALAPRADEEATLVVVDDAEQADASSVQALVSTVRHHRDVPLLVVLVRSTGRPGPTATVLEHAADSTVTLPGFDAGAVQQLALRVGIVLHHSLAEHLARHAAGRPADVCALLDSQPRETWRGLAPPLPAPPAVEADSRARLAAVDPAARALVEAVAVLGPGVPLLLAARVGEVDDALAAVDAAAHAGLLRRTGSGVETTVSLGADVTGVGVCAAMGMVREARLHGVAAEVVEDEETSLRHAVAATPAPDPELAGRVHELARVRAAEGAWASAARLYLLARECTGPAPDRGHRLLLAVDALVGAGDLPAAAGYLAEVESLPESALRNAVLGYLAILRGRAHEAGTRLARAWDLESGARHPEVAATTAQRHVLHHLARCDGAGLVTWADRAVELVGAQDPTAVEAQAIRGLGLGSTGRLAEALDSYRVLAGRASGGAVGQRVQMGSGWLHLASDEVDRARAQLSSAAHTDYLGGSTRISLWARAWLARTHFVSGEWDLALQQAEAGLATAERSGIALLAPLLQWTVTQVHALRDTADPAVDGIRAGSPSDYEIMRVPGCLARAALAEARADYAGVLTALHPLTRDDVMPDVAEPGFWPWPDVYANALVLEGRLEEAGAFLDVHEERARDREHRSAQARLGYARGRLLGATGDLPASRRRFEASLELLEALPLVYDRARVTFAYGQTLRRAGKRREADAVMTAAREDWATLGATTYVRRCDRELKAGGVAAVARARPDESLTPQEQAVAGLVSRGLTNREAAAELFLSVKTVQFHLTRVYAKLGVRSRSELAALAPELPEVPGPSSGVRRAGGDAS